MKNLLSEAKALFDQNELSSSMETVSRYLSGDKENMEALLLRARIQYKMQRWGDAMNDYYAVLEVDPHNQEAKSGVEMAISILGYFTPDMFNP
jgi:hypothetical protein